MYYSATSYDISDKIPLSFLKVTLASGQLAEWQLQEKCQEQNGELYTTFINLTKAFDAVGRDGPW